MAIAFEMANEPLAALDAGARLGTGAELTVAALAELDLAAGTPVWASVKGVDLTVYER